MESGLKLYSLGIVVDDKPDNTDMVLVSPIEVLNIQTPGSILNHGTKFVGSLNNGGSSFKTEVSSTNYLRAKWLPIGQSNRITSPCVNKNETVLLFKFGDVDEYYWTTLFREVELRRLETVLYGFSNIKSGIIPFDKLTSYWMEISTKNKTIKLHTAMNDGEFTEYDINIDTKNGTLIVKDKRNNTFAIDSKKDLVTIRTNNNIIASAGKSIDLESPIINLKGNVNIQGNLDVKGNANISGKCMDGAGNSNHHAH